MSGPNIYIPASYSQVLHVARNMREWDAREIWPMRRSKTPEDLASACVQSQVCGIVRLDRPVVAFGFQQAGVGKYQAWMFATDEWLGAALTLTKFARRKMVPHLFEELGANRVEARSMVGHDDAQAWMRSLGARDECVLEDYGYGREPYVLFSITRTTYEKEYL